MRRHVDLDAVAQVQHALATAGRTDEAAALEKIAEIRDVPNSVYDGLPPFDFGECLKATAEFVEDILCDVDWDKYRVVGFSSTHVQFLSSLLLAKGLRRQHRDLPIVFGGYLLRDELAEGVVDLFPFVDYVATGEGEVPLYELVRALRGEQDLAEVPGLVWKGSDGRVHLNSEVRQVEDLDDLPIPDYTDYFRHQLRSEITPHPQVQLEISRGCFWGRCSFCVESMRPRTCYRRKSAAKVVEEIEQLAGECGSLDFMFTDADVSDAVDVFAAIAELDLDLSFTAELTGFIDRDGLATLRDAGVKLVQIGVEALDDRLLRRFMKGVKFMKYVELMKWCQELDLGLFYNLIVGAPFETQEDVEKALSRIPALKWFQYPHITNFVVSAGSKIWVNPSRFGIREIVPARQAIVCYPEDVAVRIAPLVDFGESSGHSFLPPCDVDHTEMLAAIARWKEEYESDRATLTCRRGRDFIDIAIFEGKSEYHYVLREPAERDVYFFCMDSAKSIEELRRAFPDIEDDALQQSLARFEQYRLMLSDGEQYLSLASYA